MRSLIVLTLTCACGSTLPTPKSTTPDRPSLVGSIDGRSFRAWSALMTTVNMPARMCSTAITKTDRCSTETDGIDISHSTIQIFERAVSCADLQGVKGGNRDVPRLAGEHTVDIVLQGIWPTPRHTVFTVRTSEDDPSRDHAEASLTRVVDRGPLVGTGDGIIAFGTLEISDATPTGAVLSLDLQTDSDGNAVKGTIPLTVCP